MLALPYFLPFPTTPPGGPLLTEKKKLTGGKAGGHGLTDDDTSLLG